MRRLYWYVQRDDSGRYNGHVWEYGYLSDHDGDRLVAVRCHLCRLQPMEVLLRGGGFGPCCNWRA